MKTLSIKSILLLSLVVMLFNSCQKDAQTALADIDYSQLTKKYKHQTNQLIEGEFEIAATTTDELIILVNPSKNGSKQYYVLQTEKLKDQKIHEYFKQAKLMFLGGDIIIDSKEENKRILLSIGSNKDLEKDIQFTSIIKGYGIGKFANSENAFNTALDITAAKSRSFFYFPIVPIDVDKIKCKCVKNSTVKQCSSGGEGSTSCSLSTTDNGFSDSCSVSCSSGYYACCNYN